MSRTLKPQFKDMRVCSHCGAPAEIIGKPWNHDGIEDWYREPIEIPATALHKMAQARERKRKVGMRTESEPYFVLVFTHLCTRRARHDAQGKRSDDPALAYECGAIHREHTRQVAIDQLPETCFDSDEVHDHRADLAKAYKAVGSCS